MNCNKKKRKLDLNKLNLCAILGPSFKSDSPKRIFIKEATFISR